jgi:hypothetical protein
MCHVAAATWPRAVYCVCAFLVWKRTHSRRSDPVVAGATQVPPKFQRGAWRGDVCEAARARQHLIRQPSINRLIVHST